MRKVRQEAKQLRLSGKSYREIANILKVSPSTLSGWFGKEDWSRSIRKKLEQAAQERHGARLLELNALRGANLVRVYEDARIEARKELESLKYNPLFIAGLMLYWGEGDKAGRDKVRLTNTDAEMINLFVLFLKNVLLVREDKIHGHVLVYPDLNEQETKRYWARHAGLPLESFGKSTLIQGRHKTKRLGHGVCMIFVSSTYLKVKVLEWLKILPGELIERAYYENIAFEADMV